MAAAVTVKAVSLWATAGKPHKRSGAGDRPSGSKRKICFPVPGFPFLLLSETLHPFLVLEKPDLKHNQYHQDQTEN
jgi:hypothetical protein